MFLTTISDQNPMVLRKAMSNELVLNFFTKTMVLCRFSGGPTMVLRKTNSCLNHHHVDNFDTTYKDESAFSDTPAMDLRVGHAPSHFLHDLPCFAPRDYFLHDLPRFASPRACMHFLNDLPWFAPHAWTHFLCDLPRIASSIITYFLHDLQ